MSKPDLSETKRREDQKEIIRLCRLEVEGEDERVLRQKLDSFSTMQMAAVHDLILRARVTALRFDPKRKTA